MFFKLFSLGVGIHRDAWACNFKYNVVAQNMQSMIETYNEHVFKWQAWMKNFENGKKFNDLDKNEQQQIIDNFVIYDDKKISWSHTLKVSLKRNQFAEFKEEKIRKSMYRPFQKNHLFYDRICNQTYSLFYKIFPTPDTEKENKIIWLKVGSAWPMFALATNILHIQRRRHGTD